MGIQHAANLHSGVEASTSSISRCRVSRHHDPSAKTRVFGVLLLAATLLMRGGESEKPLTASERQLAENFCVIWRRTRSGCISVLSAKLKAEMAMAINSQLRCHSLEIERRCPINPLSA